MGKFGVLFGACKGGWAIKHGCQGAKKNPKEGGPWERQDLENMQPCSEMRGHTFRVIFTYSFLLCPRQSLSILKLILALQGVTFVVTFANSSPPPLPTLFPHGIWDPTRL